MSPKKEKPPLPRHGAKKIRVSKDGPSICSGGIPLSVKEIRNDKEGYCSTWHDVTTYPLQEQYALCRCGHSKNKPFCDVTHTKIHFDGTETAKDEPYLDRAYRITGPTLSLTDAEGNARSCPILHAGRRDLELNKAIRQSRGEGDCHKRGSKLSVREPCCLG